MANKFKSFFNNYSKNVNNADSQFYWRLSDEIILSIIRHHIKPPLSRKNVILDAGGGTGRWIEKLSTIYKSRFILYDLSKSMLKVAKVNKKLTKLEDRLEIINGNLEKMSTIDSRSVDFAISIYNPISFASKPIKVLEELSRILKKNGLLLLMGQAFYNAVYSKVNNYLASDKELIKLQKNKQVVWNDSLPPLNVFTKESLEDLAILSGFQIIKVYGIPVFIQPKNEDFDPQNNKKSDISKKLEEDSGFYKTVLNLEMMFNSVPSVVNRGMNIMIVAKKI